KGRAARVPVNAGRTNAKGLPDPFQLALVARAFADVVRFTKPPASVQTVLFSVRGAVGKLRGYRAIYPEYLHPHGRVTPDPEAADWPDRRGDLADRRVLVREGEHRVEQEHDVEGPGRQGRQPPDHEAARQVARALAGDGDRARAGVRAHVVATQLSRQEAPGA